MLTNLKYHIKLTFIVHISSGPVDLSYQIFEDDPALMNKTEGVPHTTRYNKGKTESKGTEVDKQFAELIPISPSKSIFPEGTTVRVIVKGEKRICIVDKVILRVSGLLCYKICPLDGTTTCTVSEKNLEYVHPEPGDIPLKLSDVENTP